MQGIQKTITVLMLLMIGCIGGLGWLISPNTTVGIQVMHNGKPLNNLEIKIYDTGYTDDQLLGTLTTDGTGIATHTVTNSEVYLDGGQMLYDFTFNGTTYSFAGPKNQIIVESV